jgi:hypothetical protein
MKHRQALPVFSFAAALIQRAIRPGGIIWSERMRAQLISRTKFLSAKPATRLEFGLNNEVESAGMEFAWF